MCDDKNNVAVYLEEIAPQTAKQIAIPRLQPAAR
jgi:hypothetical protein